jgi:hypothetical protein
MNIALVTNAHAVAAARTSGRNSGDAAQAAPDSSR